MKLLLTTIKGECKRTELDLRYLYGIVADAPIDSTLKMFDEVTLDLDIYDEIVRGQYNIVYLHIDESNERRIITVSEMIKKALPSTVVIAGGLQVSFDTGAFMESNPQFDYVIRGEGELVLFNFIRTLLTYEFDFENIAGLAYRSDEGIVVNPYEALVSPEDLPFPYDKCDLYDTSEVYYETIRGTSDRSIYSQHIPDPRVRSLSLNRVCTELRYFIVKKVERLVFLDKWFNYNTERAYRIFEYIINNDNGITSFEMNMDGDNLDDETIRLLSEARKGLFTFSFDVASTNAETLAAVGRKENIYQLMYNVNKLMQVSKVGIELNVTAGLPLETEALFARSFNKVYGLGENTKLRVHTLRIRRGSLLSEKTGRFGYLYSSYPPYEVISTSLMPALDLINIKATARVVDRFAGGEFRYSTQRLMTDASLKPYEFFKKLGEFISENGLGNRLGKTEDRFRVMYQYAVNIYEEINDTLKLQIMMESLNRDLENALPEESIKKFERKGWDIETW